jgi:hypothetical protein
MVEIMILYYLCNIIRLCVKSMGGESSSYTPADVRRSGFDSNYIGNRLEDIGFVIPTLFTHQ